jgi:hypothetical protein
MDKKPYGFPDGPSGRRVFGFFFGHFLRCCLLAGVAAFLLGA